MKHWLNTSAGLQEYNIVFFHNETQYSYSAFCELIWTHFQSDGDRQIVLIFGEMETVHLLISGKVQGVFFRETSRHLAEKLHIKGWIKNTPDGEVEALITGDEEALNDFLDFCEKGPERAVVDKVKVSKQQKIDFDKFEIIRKK